MKHTENTFPGSGGMQLVYQTWRPETAVKAVLALVHGIGEHSGRYQHLVGYFVPKGYVVYGFDHRGHGRSPGQRGHINHWDEFRGDVQAYVQLIAKQEPGLPIFLLGHSLGGLITLDYLLHSPDGLRGAIVSAPPVSPAGMPPFLQFLSRVLSRLSPTLSINNSLDINGVSRETAVVQAYLQDPLNHPKGTPRFGASFLDTTNWIQTHVADWKLPLLMYHGDADRLTNPRASRQFFDKIPYPDKTYISYPGGYHESHNDIHKEQVFADIEQWLGNRL